MQDHQIEMIFGIGGDKIQSSSSLINKHKNYQKRDRGDPLKIFMILLF